MTGISIALDAREALAALEGFEKMPDDMTPLMHNIGALGVQSTVDRIALTNRAPDGTPWEPSERAKREGNKTLQDTARLRDSIDYIADTDRVLWGTNVVYGRIHQLGGTIKREARTQNIFRRVNKARTGFLSAGRFVKRSKSNFAQSVNVGAHNIALPARPYLGLSRQDEADIAAVSVEFIAEGRKR